MLNQVVLVGRINNIELNNDDTGQTGIITIGVPRAYKNSEGNYDTDFIRAILNKGIINNVVDSCKIGDIIGVKGRLENILNQQMIIAEKVTFLAKK